ncbi:MAG: response regulator transcription factor [Bacteroidales bacterium]|nr:response regulator transcription factor [Bacteroidales bacterium]
MTEDRKITCIAIDDEPLALMQVEAYIRKTPFLKLEGSFSSAVEAGQFLVNRQVDALFVDINMPDLSGMEFIRSISNPPLVVFTTAYSEYAVESYKVDAVDYLLKPFSLEDFQRAAHKVAERCQLLAKARESSQPAEISQVDKDESVYLKTDYKVVKLRLADIRYVEGMGEYLKIHTDDQPRPLVVLLSMKKMEDRLKGHSFMRVHKSYIVNLGKIMEVSRGKITMEAPACMCGKDFNEEPVPVGDLYRDEFQSYIDSKFLGK